MIHPVYMPGARGGGGGNRLPSKGWLASLRAWVGGSTTRRSWWGGGGGWGSTPGVACGGTVCSVPPKLTAPSPGAIVCVVARARNEGETRVHTTRDRVFYFRISLSVKKWHPRQRRGPSPRDVRRSANLRCCTCGRLDLALLSHSHTSSRPVCVLRSQGQARRRLRLGRP